MRTTRVLGYTVTGHLNSDGVLHDLPGPSSWLTLAQECSALLHLGHSKRARNTQAVLTVYCRASKLGTVVTASLYVKAATSEAPAARTTAKSDKEILEIASWS